jgi:hypothetical protein
MIADRTKQIWKIMLLFWATVMADQDFEGTKESWRASPPFGLVFIKQVLAAEKIWKTVVIRRTSELPSQKPFIGPKRQIHAEWQNSRTLVTGMQETGTSNSQIRQSENGYGRWIKVKLMATSTVRITMVLSVDYVVLLLVGG